MRRLRRVAAPLLPTLALVVLAGCTTGGAGSSAPSPTVRSESPAEPALERREVELLAGNRLERYRARGLTGWELCVVHEGSAWAQVRHGMSGSKTRSGPTGGCPG